ncbi:hypothetical protein [Streptomyces sp. MNU89]|uniref:hypothetical protein n=1 Tax=Streptomyces sp. MNU89 TaxID=2560025 RepID=UPI001E5381F8|nr:hypothetical protein [Streptomyces sp. MNU89]MCC9740514.1 hypothetical protein [Streptomyces sp. MNU89]
MITARPPFGTRRFRSWAEPLRVLWLAALVFGVVYAHAVSTEGVTGHLSVPAPAAAAMSPASHVSGTGPGAGSGPQVIEGTAPERPGGGHGHDPSHPVQECVPGQPQQGPGSGAPCASSPAGEGNIPHVAPSGLFPGGSVAAEPPPVDSSRTVVLRI